MSYATVLFFDPAMEDAVYTVWDALETVVDQPMRASGIRPHVTLTSGDHIDEGALAAALATFAASTQPFRLTLSSVGLFATGEGVLFFGVTVSRALLELHAEYSRIFGRAVRQADAYYRLGAWVPHCTLAMGLRPEQVGEAVAIARRAPLPLHGNVAEMALVRVPNGPVETLGLFQLGARP
ncbi:MAG: 2'-5' RNA ligase family protein [Candidatus Promineofilum sp.]|nr:2'-5' RNA ligase family protein [Promineifilum sp.]MCW5861963.1 2'-5' RNA ligase family protein [Anaerolineae bacterium]